MRCISPLLIRTNGRRDVVPCGRCNFCLEVKRGEWSFRIAQELKRASSAKFVTLTYADNRIPITSTGEMELNKKDVQDFKKRLRKENAKYTADQVRYYTVGEYGTETDRPHYHSILFNVHPSVLMRLQLIWDKGIVHQGNVEIASIHYVTKYVINRIGEYETREPP